MPGDHGIVTGRHALDFKGAVRLAHRKERVLHDADVRLHPRVLIALYRHQNFSARKSLFDGRRANALRLVPVRIVLWRKVDVVLRRIAVGDLQLLIRLDTHNVRHIVATVLIQCHFTWWAYRK